MRRTTVVGAALFAAWAAHDAEELLTMQATSRDVAASAPAWLPIPADIWRDGLSKEHVRLGVGLMAAVVGAAAAEGIRTDGRSPFFRAAVQAFGWHGVGHLAMSAVGRRYVSGVATSPVVVIPYWIWARRELAAGGAPLESSGLRSTLLLPPILLGVHVAARALTRGRGQAPAVAQPT